MDLAKRERASRLNMIRQKAAGEAVLGLEENPHTSCHPSTADRAGDAGMARGVRHPKI